MAEAAADKVSFDDKPAGEETLVEVKEEIMDDVELELKELSSLRLRRLCNSRLYLRQGLCANLKCRGFYMLDPSEWRSTQKGKIESERLAEEDKDSLEEYKDDVQEAMAPRVDLPMPPLSHEPIIVEVILG
eukprot:s606_g8.t1